MAEARRDLRLGGLSVSPSDYRRIDGCRFVVGNDERLELHGFDFNFDFVVLKGIV